MNAMKTLLTAGLWAEPPHHEVGVLPACTSLPFFTIILSTFPFSNIWLKKERARLRFNLLLPPPPLLLSSSSSFKRAFTQRQHWFLNWKCHVKF